jgi:MraZ protein
MFTGRYYISLDDKGRIKIPSQFKKSLDRREEDTLTLTNFGNCIRAYPQEEWGAAVERFKESSMLQENKLASERLFLSSANTVKVDKQGRLLIPNSLRTETGLQEEVVLLGLDYRFEVWDKAQWDDYQKTSREKAEDIFEGLSRAGF